MIYTDNDAIKIEFNKLLIELNTSKRSIAKELNVAPQQVNNILNKKNLSFQDIASILDVIGYELEFNFKKK